MKVYKSAHGGWKCETLHPLIGNKLLHVLTMKRFSGELVTSANVKEKNENGIIFYQPFSDYRVQIISEDKRATTGNVLAQHARALLGLDAIKSRALAHYEVES